jgi:hypothetical protein
MAQQADPHRRRREERRDAFLLDQPQHLLGHRRLDQHVRAPTSICGIVKACICAV